MQGVGVVQRGSSLIGPEGLRPQPPDGVALSGVLGLRRLLCSPKEPGGWALWVGAEARCAPGTVQAGPGRGDSQQLEHNRLLCRLGGRVENWPGTGAALWSRLRRPPCRSLAFQRLCV